MPAVQETRPHIQPVEEEPSGAVIPQTEQPVQMEVEEAEVTVAGQGQGIVDFSDLPTQLVETLSQVRKRTGEFEDKAVSGRNSVLLIVINFTLLITRDSVHTELKNLLNRLYSSRIFYVCQISSRSVKPEIYLNIDSSKLSQI